MNRAYYELSEPKRKYVDRILAMPDWRAEELDALGSALRRAVEHDLQKRTEYRALFAT